MKFIKLTETRNGDDLPEYINADCIIAMSVNRYGYHEYTVLHLMGGTHTEVKEDPETILKMLTTRKK